MYKKANNMQRCNLRTEQFSHTTHKHREKKKGQIPISYLKRKMGNTQMMNKMELPMSIFVSATSREENAADDDSDLQEAAFWSLRAVTMVVTITTTITTPGRPIPYIIESK